MNLRDIAPEVIVSPASAAAVPCVALLCQNDPGTFFSSPDTGHQACDTGADT